jgi:hypothetical protein
LCNVRGAWARDDSDGDGERIASVPAALRADGSMVADESMMPFPRPRFDMDGTGCTSSEYIPCGARAAKLADRACERRGRALQRANGRGGGLEQMRGEARQATGGAEGAFGGGGGGRKGQRTCGLGCTTVVALCEVPKWPRVGPSAAASTVRVNCSSARRAWGDATSADWLHSRRQDGGLRSGWARDGNESQAGTIAGRGRRDQI